MVKPDFHGQFYLYVTFAIALCLTVVPLPDWAVTWRPEWIPLVLIFWCINLPQRIGIGTAWVVGILLDVLQGALLGQHAFALTIIAFLSLKLHKRLRVYPVWQQTLSIFVLIMLYQLFLLWISGIAGVSSGYWYYWLPSLSSMLLWPLIDMLLRAVRRGFGIQ
ncbi:MAG: rod shape-determining protein MreD [Gammaproteobacteria bacterium]|nr:rod shape-determining protein MreD [Gammaproteobacteria bacterium]